jgi:hypothetical protein
VTSSDPLDPLRHALEARAAAESLAPGPDCLDDDTIAAIADGALGAASRASALGHLAGCGCCRAAVASVARALGDPAIEREVTVAEPKPGRQRWNRIVRVVLPLAAAAMLLLVGRSRSPNDVPSESPHRAPTITAIPAPSAAWPLGTVETAALLRWSGVLGADRYHVTLYDGAGRVLYESQTSDTVAPLPDSLQLLPGHPYLWRVEARTGWNRWSASPLAQFSVVRGATR